MLLEVLRATVPIGGGPRSRGGTGLFILMYKMTS